ncbi:transposase [Salinibacter ruber]|uniref:transposase n=1 Tax=Salinibacter ruber TaxID=146919 RepID=UPI003C6E16CD
MSSRYPSNPSGAEWKQIKHMFDRFQFVEHDLRTILNGILCVPKGGIQWRMLPNEFPPWRAAHYHFRQWQMLNPFQRLCDRIRRAARVAEGRRLSPSAAVASRPVGPNCPTRWTGARPRSEQASQRARGDT